MQQELYSQILKSVDFKIAGLFFPTPGPFKYPIAERIKAQKEILRMYAPSFDMESYFKAKSILFTELLKSDGFALLNARDPYSEKLAKLCRRKIITFSTSIGSKKLKSADIVIMDKSYSNNRRLFRASYKGATIDGSLPLPGVFNPMMPH